MVFYFKITSIFYIYKARRKRSTAFVHVVAFIKHHLIVIERQLPS
jgi:hypothetical protein